MEPAVISSNVDAEYKSTKGSGANERHQEKGACTQSKDLSTVN